MSANYYKPSPMLLTFDTLRIYIASTIGTDDISALTFIIDPNAMTVKGEAKGEAGTTTGKREQQLSAEQFTQVKALARKFYQLRQPKAVKAATVQIDYKARTASVAILYTAQNGAKLKHTENHAF